MTTAINDVQKTAMSGQAMTLAETAKTLTVVDEDSYRDAGEMQKGVKALKQKIVDFFTPHIERAHAAHKALTSERKAAVDPLDEALNYLQRNMGAFKAELERQRAAELAAIKAEAEAQARLANQAVAEVEDDPFLAEQEVEEKIEAIQEAAAANIAAASSQVNAIIPKMDGQVSRANWKFEITNAALLPRDFLMPDEKAIGAMVRAKKGDTNIPGVRAYPDYKVSV